MAKLSCPYCYGNITGKRLWFRCKGEGSPGKPGCVKEEDPQRTRMTGFQEHVLPSFEPKPQFTLPGGIPVTFPARTSAICPRCDGETPEKVCPLCHTPLPHNFGDGRSPLIALVGAKGTGKTVYLRGLIEQLRAGIPERFDADVRLTGDAQFSNEILKPAAEMFPNRQLYAQTMQATNGRSEAVVFEWRQARQLQLPGRAFRTTYLSFFDTAGEDLTKQASALELRYLAAADALIVLLDPFMLPQAAQQLQLPQAAIRSDEATADVLSRVTEALRRGQRLKTNAQVQIPIAVAFAKIDAFFGILGPDHPLVQRPPNEGAYDEAAGQATHEHVRSVLHDFGGGQIDTHLRLNYRHFRYFAVSTLGAPPDYSAGLVSERGVLPFRVDEPLLWLLSRFNVIPRQVRHDWSL